MRQTGTSSIGEPLGGADGREVGRERKLQQQLDEISRRKIPVKRDPGPPRGHSSDELHERLWAAAEEVCDRQSLHPKPIDVSPPGARPLSPAEEGVEAHPSAGVEELPRACPRCGNKMNRLATLCGYCWLRVAPMGADGVEPAPLLVKRPWWKVGRR